MLGGASGGVVLPDEAGEAVQFAAGELQRYVGRMLGERVDFSGATFEIGETVGNQGLFDRLAAPAQDGDDRYVVAIDAEGVVRLVGVNDRATLYAVYEFLELQGCRWYSPHDWGEVIPTRRALLLPVMERFYEPAFYQREIGGGASDVIDLAMWVDWCVKNRLNKSFAARPGLLRRDFPKDRSKWTIWDQRGRQLEWQWIAHNFSFMFPAEEKWFERHPEYFALYKGKRVPVGTAGRPGYGGGNLALQNPDVVEHAANFAIEWFDKHPYGSIVPMWPGDGAIKWDESPEAMALGGVNFMPGSQGSMTRRLVTFTNRVAKRVAEKYPDRLILLPAYANYIEPIEGVTLEPNIMVQYCYHGSYAHGPNGSAHNREGREQMQQWAAQAPGRLGIWEYFLIGDHHVSAPTPVILPLVYRIRDTIGFLRGDDIDARYYFTQSNNAYVTYNPLVYYALARYVWDPTLDADELIASFCDDMYGPAGSTIATFYQMIERQVADSGWEPVVYSDVAVPSPKVFTAELVERLTELLVRAESMSSQLDDVQTQRLAMVRQAFDYTVSNVSTQAATGLSADVTWRLQRGEDAYVINADGQAIDEKRYNALVQHAVDTGAYTANFERLIFRARKRVAPVVRIANDRLEIAAVPEIGGRLIRMIDKQTGRNFLREKPGGEASANSDKLENIGQAYFNYGGYEEYIGKEFAAPGWETSFTAERVDDRTLRLTGETDHYRLQRTVSLPAGDQMQVSVSSVLTNIGEQAQAIRLRVHPMFDVSREDADNAEHVGGLRWLGDDGQVAGSTVAEQHDGLAVQPNGAWALVNEKDNVAVVNRFDPAQVEQCYAFRADGGAWVNLELFGREQTLATGESLRIDQVYVISIDAANELDALLQGKLPEPKPHGEVLDTPDRDANVNTNASTKKNQATSPDMSSEVAASNSSSSSSSSSPTVARGGGPVKPVAGEPVYGEGQLKEAALFGLGHGAGLLYPASCIKAETGTIEMWVKLPEAARDTKQASILGVGQNNPGWFNVGISEGQLVLLFKYGRSPYRDAEEFYASLTVDISDWPAQTWRHLAIVWAHDDTGPQQSTVKVYMDGELLDARFNMPWGKEFDGEHLIIGRSSAQVAKLFDGMIDDLRISNRPRKSGEIRGSFTQGRHGRALRADASTLLLLDFDGTAIGQSKTQESITPRALEAAINRLRTEQ